MASLKALLLLSLSQSFATKPQNLRPEALSRDDLQAPVCLLQRGVGQGGHHAFDDIPLRKELLAVQKAQQEINAAQKMQKTQQDRLKQKRRQEMTDMASVHFDFDNVPVRKELLAAQRTQVPKVTTAPQPVAKVAKVPKVANLNKALPKWPNSLEDLLGQRIFALRHGAKVMTEEQELQLEDQRLRQEDDRLRLENERLQHALAQLSGVTNRSGSMAEDMVTMLASLVEEAPKSEKPPKLPNSGKNYMGTGSPEMDPKKRIITVSLIIIGGACLIGYYVYHAYMALKHDPNGDGIVDLGDLDREFWSRLFCFGLSYKSALSMSFVFVIACGGFGFLWWQGIIQPFLKEIACYVYLGLILALLVGVIFAELWSRFFDVFSTQMAAMERIMKFMHLEGAQEKVEEIFQDGLAMVRD